MNTILRTILIFAFLLLLTKGWRKRSLTDISTFDFLLIAIIAVLAAVAIIGQNPSFTNMVIAVLAIAGLDYGLVLLRKRYKKVDTFLEQSPVIILEHGQPIPERLQEAGLFEADILEAARRLQGIQKLEEIRYAVLEKNGAITIIPEERS